MIYLYYAIGIIAILLILLFSSRSRIKSKYTKYLKIPNQAGLTGEQVANIIMNKKSLDIELGQNEEDLCDAYYPNKKLLLMSSKVCNTPSIASVAIVCHELGHATQHKEKTLLYCANMFLSKLTRFTNHLIIPLFIFGLFAFALRWPTEDIGIYMCMTSIILFLLHAVVKIIIIPLEFDASKRAIKMIQKYGLLTKKELQKSRSLLNTAGQTYIVALFDDFNNTIKKIFKKR